MTREHSTVCRLRQGNGHAHTSLNTCIHDRIREIARTGIHTSIYMLIHTCFDAGTIRSDRRSHTSDE